MEYFSAVQKIVKFKYFPFSRKSLKKRKMENRNLLRNSGKWKTFFDSLWFFEIIYEFVPNFPTHHCIEVQNCQIRIHDNLFHVSPNLIKPQKLKNVQHAQGNDNKSQRRLWFDKRPKFVNFDGGFDDCTGAELWLHFDVFWVSRTFFDCDWRLKVAWRWI